MTAPQIPDAAVEAYLRATAQTSGACGADEYVANCRTWAGGLFWEDTRAGLAAALPHLLPAAPSGETAPRHVPLGQVYADGRWVEVVAPAPAGGEVAAASVPARTNAQATPADVMDLVRQYGRSMRNAALFEATGSHQPAAERRARAEYVLDLIRVELERPAAAPSGEQPTTEPGPECSDPREPNGCPWEDHEHDEYFHVVDGEWRRRVCTAPHHLEPRVATQIIDGEPRCYSCSFVIRSRQARGADDVMTVHLDNRTATFTPTTEPAGEADRD